MAIILYVWGFILVPLVVQYAGFAPDGREVYALHGGAVVVASLFLLFGSTRHSSVVSSIAVEKKRANNENHETIGETMIGRSSSFDDVVAQEGVSLTSYCDDYEGDDRAVLKTPWYVRFAIVCATKFWSLVSFVWLCLFFVALVVPVNSWYFLGVGSLLLIVWLWGGLVRHPFPFSFFGFVMNVREWVQWIGLSLFCGVLLLFGDSGKFSIRVFIAVSIVLLLFWILRLLVPRIRRIRGSKFRLFRLLIGVWFIFFVIILFHAFLFARGHIVQSRQHMQALMREYITYHFYSFFDDVRQKLLVGFFVDRFFLLQTSFSASQNHSLGEEGVSGLGGLHMLSGYEEENEVFIQSGLRKNTEVSLQKVKDHELDSHHDSVSDVKPTFREILRFLLATYPKTTTKYVFRNVPVTDPDYLIFATARRLNMIGTDIDPNRLVVCQTFFVMQGLVEGWTVSGQGTIFDKYWNEARRRGVVGSCEWGKTVPVSLYTSR